MSRASIKVLYFAWLREKLGVAEEDIELAPGVTTVAALTEWLSASSPRHEAAFAAGKTVRCAVNQDFAAPDAPIRAGDEVAFFPPVTGG